METKIFSFVPDKFKSELLFTLSNQIFLLAIDNDFI